METKSEELKQIFEQYLSEKTQELFPDKSSLNEAILYSLMAPAKRIRPLLCLGFAQGFKAPLDVALACGLSVEMIHTYSLIHDDLPSMDNDDFRRGRPTNHKVFGEALAILAGDSLLTLAPSFLLDQLQKEHFPPEYTIRIVSGLLQASGHRGMVLGQALDMKYESEELRAIDVTELERILKDIHRLKTGSLISWSCQAGLLASGKKDFINHQLPQVQALGEKIGLLFQIVDDVLDVTATLEEIGKTPGKDHKTGKLTYTQLHGLQGARSLGMELSDAIDHSLDALGEGDWRVIQEIVLSLRTKLHHS